MRYPNRIAILLLAAALLLCACRPVARAPSADAQPPHGLRLDAPPYAVHGPYAVGTREVGVAAGDHTVDFTVWYPAANPKNVQEAITYQVGANVPDMAGVPITGKAIADAAPATEQGPYPLVVFSPGLAGWKQANSYLLEHLASYGFVVIASDPRGETFTEFWQGAGTRPVDTQVAIDFADKLTAAGGELAGLIDTERIAVAGHSSGGWAALAGGGAQMDFGWCAANPDIVAENSLSNCTQFVPHADDIAAIRGLGSTPSGMWPPTNDPRVAAVVALAPDGDIWGADYQGVAAVKVPTLVMAGTADTVNIPERCAYPIYEHLGSAKKSLITFAGGNHMIFFNQCRDTPWMLPDMYWACSDAVWDMDRAHDLVNHFVTAFLLSELKGDANATAAVAPENMVFPGIDYKTTAYPAAAAPTLDAATTAKIESILTNTMQSVGVPGYATCVVKDGNLVYSKGFGTAELGKDLPITPQSVFSLRSTTKSFTAMALMQLVEQGKVDLDEPVTTYLPYFTMADPHYKDITVRLLASHTSGLVDDTTFASMPPKREEPAETGAAIEWFVRSLADDSLTAAPPTDWQYAGTNFILLGDIIGKVSGEPYDVYVTKHLLEPLGMVHSTLDKSAIPPGALVGEHVTDAGGVIQAAPLSDYGGFESPEGGIYSTCEDMARWMQVHINGGELDGARILQPESYAVLWHPEAPTGLDAVFGQWIADVALGWVVGEEQGHLLAGHPGGGAGQNIGFQLAPDDLLGVTVLANWGTETIAYPAWTAAVDALYALLGISPQ